MTPEERQRARAQAERLLPDYKDVLDGWFGGMVIHYVPRWVDAGLPDDEIMDFASRWEGPGVSPQLAPLRVQRAAEAYASVLRRRPPETEELRPTRAEIEAAMTKGLKGYTTLARRFHVSPTTIRRRLGRTK